MQELPLDDSGLGVLIIFNNLLGSFVTKTFPWVPSPG